MKKPLTEKQVLRSDEWYLMNTAKLECSIKENIEMAHLYLRFRADKQDIILVRRDTKRIMFKMSL